MDEPRTKGLAAAFAATPREGFLREPDRARAAYDGPLGIGAGQTSSQPRTVAAMLELLDVRPGMSVLDVGAGSGWTTALLAHLVGPEGSVLGLELVPELARWGAANLAATGRGWARLEQAAPDVLGAPGRAPFDRVLVSAMADELPDDLVAQLADGGRMVVPVDGRMVLLERDEHGEVRTSTHGRYRFVPLVRGSR